MHTKDRRVSAGTIFMLIAVLLTLAGTAAVIILFSPGKLPDRTAADTTVAELTEIPSAAEIRAPEAGGKTAAATEAPTAEPPRARSYTMTFAGTAALAGEVRQNSYYSDVKQYDYYDIMLLLRDRMRTDMNVVFLENILSVEGKVSDVTATNAAAAMLKAAGFRVAACGFSGAFDKAEAGVESTRSLLTEYGIQPVGIGIDAASAAYYTEINGISTAFLQYTDTIPQATRRNMAKKEQTGMVPPADAEAIAADIARARERGCDPVIVLLQWGKTGKAPDKAQRALAQSIADAGADLIVGAGSRIVSGAETLTAQSGKQVLCVWSLGCAVSGDRSRISRIAGMLLHATVRQEGDRTTIGGFSYTPVYTWKYKMDGRTYYRCLPAAGDPPDGMDAEEQKRMKTAADTVRQAMKDTPAEESQIE